MTVSLKHAFTSNVADSSDASLVQPSNWNAEHTLTAAANTLLGAVTAGAVTEITCTSAGRALLDDADAAAQRTTLSAAGTGVTNTFTANQIIEVTDNTNAALRVTQLGTGNAILVEDSTNPDSTPFVVKADGRVGIGVTSPVQDLDVNGNIQAQTSGSGGNSPFLILTNTSGATLGSFGPSVSFDNSVANTHSFVIGQLQSTGSQFIISNNESPYTNYFSVSQSGNIGVNVVEPIALLDVAGAARSGGNATYSGDITIRQKTNSATGIGGLEFKSDEAGSGYGARILTLFDGSSAYDVGFQTRTNSASWSTRMTLKSGGELNLTNTATISSGTGPTNSLNFAANGWTTVGRLGRNGTNGAYLYLTNNWNPYTNTIDASGLGSAAIRVEGSTNGLIALSTGAQNAVPTDRVLIDYAGNIGINDNPLSYAKMHIKNDRASTYYSMILDNYNSGGFENAFVHLFLPSVQYIGNFQAADLGFLTNNLERMRIKSAGNVGIGTSDPQTQFEIVGPTLTPGTATTYALGLANSGGGASRDLTFGSNGTYAYTQSWAGKPLYLNSQGNSVIVGTGGLLVATTSIGAGKVNISGYQDGTFYGIFMTPTANAASPIAFTNAAGTVVGTINTNATATAYNTSSDYRLKEDWQPVQDASSRLLSLNPVNFAWKSDGSRVDGFLAHEVQAIIPEAVCGAKDAVDKNGAPVYQGIDQSKMVPLIVAVLQDVVKRIDNLEAGISATKTITPQ